MKDREGNWGISWLLLIGDLVVLWIFAFMGRAEHQAGISLPAVLHTAAPFMVAWLMVGFLLRGFRAGRYLRYASAVKWTVLLWGIGIPLGLAFRAVLLQRGIPLSFAVITLVFNFVLLMAWRLLFSWRLQRSSR